MCIIVIELLINMEEFMENDIQIGDYSTKTTICCGEGIRGRCKICYDYWQDCRCGKSNELCSCGEDPGLDKIYKEIENEKNKIL